jgi:hypothetical protein
MLKARKKRGDSTPISNDDKHFACDRNITVYFLSITKQKLKLICFNIGCGMKYKTKPGLNYHMKNVNCTSSSTFVPADKTTSSSINLISQNSNSNHGAGMTNSRTHDPDENTTNSLFESAYDEQNSSSSFHSRHVAASSSGGGAVPQQSESKFLVQPDVIHKNKCNICLGNETDAQANPKSEKFVLCSECTRTFHPVCLNFPASMIDSLRKYNWQCVECKSM